MRKASCVWDAGEAELGRERMHVFVRESLCIYSSAGAADSHVTANSSWGKQHNLHCGPLYVKGLMRGTMKCGLKTCGVCMHSEITTMIITSEQCR